MGTWKLYVTCDAVQALVEIHVEFTLHRTLGKQKLERFFFFLDRFCYEFVMYILLLPGQVKHQYRIAPRSISLDGGEDPIVSNADYSYQGPD